MILKAAQRCIPKGIQKNYRPFWNSDLETNVAARQQARDKMEEDPSPTNKSDYNKHCAIVKRTTNVAKREKWRKDTSNLDLRKDGKKAWTLLENLSGARKKVNPTIIPDCGTPLKRAEKFNKHFASINKSRTDRRNDKDPLQELKGHEKNKETDHKVFTDNFTLQELEQAMKKLKNHKSPGPDEIHNEMLKHLGPCGKSTLLTLINLTWRESQLPQTWKNAIIAPILKKDKDPKDMTSYRPISLTSCVGKLAERMVNTRLYWWLESAGVLADEQAGFRSSSRTEEQLFRLCQNIQDGFQEKTQTTAVFVDLKQAYDRVWRKGLLLKMQRLGIKGNLYNWIKNFLANRTIQTKVNNTLSSKHTIEDGLPQGSSLSCTLFLIFLNDLPSELKSKKALYADDLVIWHTHKYVRQNARHLNADLARLMDYCTKWKLTINVDKTVYSTFSLSPKSAKHDLDIRIGSIPVKKDSQPTYLGVQLDSRLSFTQNTENILKKSNKRLRLLKRLASTSWGSDMDTLRNLYIGYIRSVFDYNQGLQLTGNTSNQEDINKVQNHALRFICGGMKSTPTSACEIMTNIEPLNIRRQKAALESSERYKRLNPKHPARTLVDNWKPKNRIKHQSILHKIKDIEKKVNLPESRKEIERVACIKPNSIPKGPEISLHLKKHANKQTDLMELKRQAEDSIADYPNNWIHVYTDGSAFGNSTYAGCGVLIHFPDGQKQEISKACGHFCSNYEAELIGIETAVTHLIYQLF